MQRLKVATIFGTRPEAIKMAPVVKALEQEPGYFKPLVIVTAQHRQMLDQVLSHFGIEPAYDLDIMQPRQTLTQITVKVLEGLEAIFSKDRPDIVLVHGDTTTTLAASLAAFYQQITLGHVEAGLRTRQKFAPFPEEMNRHLTGVLADLHFAPTATARDNLLSEGVDPDRIVVTGNTVVDALLWTVRDDYMFTDDLLSRLDFQNRKVILAEAHRRENWGGPLEQICLGLRDIAAKYEEVEILFSVHRNPVVQNTAHGILGGHPRIHLLDPVDYPVWANLMNKAYLVASDSGGIQEEAPALGKPVLLFRETTERPEAIAAGTVRMVGTKRENIAHALSELIEDYGAYRQMATAINPYGDGRAAQRIVEALLFYFGLREEKPVQYS